MDRFSKINKLKLSKELIELRKNYKEKGVPSALEETLNELTLHLSIKQPKSILEIGTATGISGIAMLETCKTAYLTTIEKDEASFEEAKINFEKFAVSSKVKQFLGDAGEYINFFDEKFDFIFLDGAKSRYVDYLYDIKRLMNNGAVLFADNVLFRGYVDGDVPYGRGDNAIVNNLRKFLNAVIADKDFLCSVYEIGDGILIAQKIC